MLFLEQVVHQAEQLVFAWLLKINIDWSRNLSPLSVHSQTALLQQWPIEHNLSIIAFFVHSLLTLSFFSVTRPRQRCYSCFALRTVVEPPQQTRGHIYHLTVCQDDYWIKITIWHFSFSVLAQWTVGKLLQLSTALSTILIPDLRPKTSKCQRKSFCCFYNFTWIPTMGNTHFTQWFPSGDLFVLNHSSKAFLYLWA